MWRNRVVCWLVVRMCGGFGVGVGRVMVVEGGGAGMRRMVMVVVVVVRVVAVMLMVGVEDVSRLPRLGRWLKGTSCMTAVVACGGLDIADRGVILCRGGANGPSCFDQHQWQQQRQRQQQRQ